jgi:hypothetical protein
LAIAGTVVGWKVRGAIVPSGNGNSTVNDPLARLVELSGAPLKPISSLEAWSLALTVEVTKTVLWLEGSPMVANALAVPSRPWPAGMSWIETTAFCIVAR